MEIEAGYVFLFVIITLLGLLLYFIQKTNFLKREIKQICVNNNMLSAKFTSLEREYNIKYESWRTTQERKVRKDATKRSRNIMRGQATEHLAPYMFTNKLNPKDFRFLGNPIDYIVFSGCSDVTDGVSDTIEKVILIDIKTGTSKLNKVQRRIRDAVKEGRVEFLTYNPDKTND